MSLKDKYLSSFILFWAVMAEYFHLLFMKGGKPVYHSEKMIGENIRLYYWDDMVYFWCNETFTFIIILIVTIRLWTIEETKAVMSSVVFWFFIEWVEITLQLAKINDFRLYINDGSWLQLATCFTVYLLVRFTNKKISS